MVLQLCNKCTKNDTMSSMIVKSDTVEIYEPYFSGKKHTTGRYTQQDKQTGWWDSIIGSDKVIDTDKYFVISSDAMSCVVNSPGVDTSSPGSINLMLICLRIIYQIF